MSHAIYPGSFDPITFGHLDVIHRIHKVFSKVTVLVSHSPRKKYWFSTQERLDLVRAALANEPDIAVDFYEGLTVEYMKKVNSQILVRGLRIVADFEYELAMANTNKKLKPEIETMIVFTSPEVSFISSNMVKEVAHFGGDIKMMVPQPVVEAIAKKLRNS